MFMTRAQHLKGIESVDQAAMMQGAIAATLDKEAARKFSALLERRLNPINTEDND